MFSTLGRIVSRGKVCGLFIPMDKGLPEGIWEIRSIMGELTLVKIGQPAMENKRLHGLDLEGLFSERPLCAMTQEELNGVKP